VKRRLLLIACLLVVPIGLVAGLVAWIVARIRRRRRERALDG